MSSSQMSIRDLNKALVSHGVQNVVDHLIGAGNYNKNPTTLGMSGYQGGKGNSFQVQLTGQNEGFWYENNRSESPNDSGSGDLVDLWSLTRGLSKGDACKEINEFLGGSLSLQVNVNTTPKLRVIEPKATQKKRLADHLGGLRLVSDQTVAKYAGRLRRNQPALDYLYGRGLTQETIDFFRLGLRPPYTGKDNVFRQNALVFPLIGSGGEWFKPYGYYNVPGVSENPVDKNGWCPTSPRVSYNTKRLPTHQYLFVVEGFKDLWILHQKIQGTDLAAHCIIATSTHGSQIPIEVQADPNIFNGYTKIFVCTDSDPTGVETATAWATYIGTRAYRVNPFPEFKKKGEPKDWTDFFKAGRTVNQFTELLKNAEQMTTCKLEKTPNNLADYKAGNTYAYRPVDISGAFVNGHLYYPVIAHEVGVDPQTGLMGHARIIKIVRSDRKVMGYRALPMLRRPGALDEPIYALTDGTIISSIPKVPPNPSWDWDHIQSWINGDKKTRSISEIIEDLEMIIRSQIWLPHDDDYLILALVLVVTYVQNVFDAVPLVLATGEAGSGKSQLGEVMSKLGANGIILGETSAATITRTLDETRGFLVLDDVEKITKVMKGGNLQTDDFLQILKVSYKQSTASRAVTDTKSMTVRNLNFYGVKFMTNTSGIEDILGTRTISIQTRKARTGSFRADELDLERLELLRAELHEWSMNTATELHGHYKKHPTTNRPLEITAPLRAIIDASGRAEWQEHIDRLVERLNLEARAVDSPTAVVKEAAHRLVKTGYQSFFVEHVIMEMTTLVPENYMKEHTTDIPEWRQNEWVRNQLHQLGYIPRSTNKRARPYGRSRLMRLYPVNAMLIEEVDHESPGVLDELDQLHDGATFCKRFGRCMECPYSDIYCEIRAKSSKN